MKPYDTLLLDEKADASKNEHFDIRKPICELI